MVFFVDLKKNSLATIGKSSVDISARPKKRGRKPSGTTVDEKTTPCYTLLINGVDLNPDEGLIPYYGNCIHYPISKINIIDEVRFRYFYYFILSLCLFSIIFRFSNKK